MAQSSTVKPLTPEEFQTLEKNGKIYFLDVREPREIEELGSMRGYVNIPLSQLEKRIAEIPRGSLIVTA
jgi:rhodanese-related sulfurtransferase